MNNLRIGPEAGVRPPSPFQFERTKPLRLAAYRLAELSRRKRILEVGSGAGPVAREVAQRTGRRVWALDHEPGHSSEAEVRVVRGDAHRLTFSSESFDAVLFHFVLLWLKEPQVALREAWRVLRSGGAVLLLAEPDLTRRRDEPDTGLGTTLCKGVRGFGGTPDAGAHLGEWLTVAGFRFQGVSSQEAWVEIADRAETLHEVETLAEAGLLAPEAAREMAEAEREAPQRRVLLPLSTAVGWKE